MFSRNARSLWKRRQRPVSNSSVRYSSRCSARAHQRATTPGPRVTSKRCVMNQPARRKNDADATGTNQSDVTEICCGNTLTLSSERLYWTPGIDRRPQKCGFSFRPQSSDAKGWQRCDGHLVGNCGEPFQIPSSAKADDPVRRSVEVKILKLWNTGSPGR